MPRWKQFWENIEPWLTRVAHAELAFKIGAYIISVIPGVTIGALASFNQAPLYQVLLAGMGAMALALLVMNQAIRLTAWLRSDSTPTPRPNRRRGGRNPVAVHTNRSITLGLVIGAIAVVCLIYIFNGYLTWRSDKLGTYIVAQPIGTLRPFTLVKDKPLGIDVYGVNTGNLPIIGPNTNFQFEYPKQLMSINEEDRVMRVVEAGTDFPALEASQLNPHGGTVWTTTQDPKTTQDQWNDFVAQNSLIYLFLEFKYLVADAPKITEVCAWVRYPDIGAFHRCHGHNKSRDG